MPLRASASAVLHHVRRSLGGAVGFTLVQQGGFFASAALITQAFGAAAFGDFGQALALATILAAAGTARLELAGQLARSERRARELSRLASRLAGAIGLGATLLATVAWALAGAPAWLACGAAALAPLAWVQVAASRRVRAGAVVQAAAWRALPALAMLGLQAAAWAAGSAAWMLLSLPLGAALAAAWVVRTAWPAPDAAAPPGRGRRLWRARRAFVRSELPAFLLNAASLQGQVLLVGALAGSVDAGRYALAQRLAFAPVSLFGPALTDWLRARTIGAPASRAHRAGIGRALAWIALLSLGVHGALAVAMPAIVAAAFPAQGPVLVAVVQVLLLVGALRLVVSPLAFVLPLRGQLRRNLLGQVALFAAASGATLVGLPLGGLLAVAWCYVAAAAGVYALYLHWSWQALADGGRRPA